VNNCTFVGNLCKDPVIQRSKSGTTYVSFLLAVHTREFSKQDNRYIENTDFFDCVAYNDVARYICNNGYKGAKISVSAVAKTSAYRGNTGQKTKREVIFKVNYAEVAEPRTEKRWHSSNWI
jgi:single-strand DNA-binding protein